MFDSASSLRACHRSQGVCTSSCLSPRTRIAAAKAHLRSMPKFARSPHPPSPRRWGGSRACDSVFVAARFLWGLGIPCDLPHRLRSTPLPKHSLAPCFAVLQNQGLASLREMTASSPAALRECAQGDDRFLILGACAGITHLPICRCRARSRRSEFRPAMQQPHVSCYTSPGAQLGRRPPPGVSNLSSRSRSIEIAHHDEKSWFRRTRCPGYESTQRK